MEEVSAFTGVSSPCHYTRMSFSVARIRDAKSTTVSSIKDTNCDWARKPGLRSIAEELSAVPGISSLCNCTYLSSVTRIRDEKSTTVSSINGTNHGWDDDQVVGV